MDDLVETINFKVDCVRKSPDLKGISKIRKVFISTSRGMSEVRSLEKVMRKLSEANIDLLVLEEDIIPNLPNSFNQEEMLSIFRLNHFEDFEE